MNCFVNKIKISIEGKNIERFIHRLVANKIELLKIKPISRKKTVITIYEKDYESVLSLKSIYEVNVINTYGLIKIKEKLFEHRILYIAIIFGFCLLLFLSNIIFNIDIVHSNSDLRELVQKELVNNGIKKYAFVKSYKEINDIKKEVLNRHKDKIEWLEIERVGTKYIVRVEERKIKDNKTDDSHGHIIAKKSAIIKSVKADSGEIIKNTNDYVRAGDIIISGDISLNGEVKNSIRASGEVFGEVWYTVNIEYPFIYYEEKLTGKTKSIYSLKILNKRYELFNLHPFKNKKIEEKNIIKNNYLPISLVKEKQSEMELIQEFHTYDSAIKKCEALAREKIEGQLNDKEYIISQKNLKVSVKDSRISVDVFFSIYENITDFIKTP